jgi:hypothetical protein
VKSPERLAGFDRCATAKGLRRFFCILREELWPGNRILSQWLTHKRFRNPAETSGTGIAGQAEKMHKAGIPAEEAQQRYVVLEKFKNFQVYAWGFTIGPAIAKLYAEWGAK